MLRGMANKTRKSEFNTIFHSDKDGKYKSKRFRRKLKRLGYSQSMTLVNHCFDNADAESLFGIIKN